MKSNFISETVNSETYFLTNSFSLPKKEISSVYLLPTFDEFIISYRNRKDSLSIENQPKVLTPNRIFKPTIGVNEQMVGIWKRTKKKDTVLMENVLFESQDKSLKIGIEKAAKFYEQFLDKKMEILHL